jgi:putative flippase GtrA
MPDRTLQTLIQYFRQIGWFGFVGVLATATYAGAAAGAIEFLGFERQSANLLALVCSSVVSYCGHRYLTFQAEGSHSTYLPRFAVQVIVTFLVSSGATYAAEIWNLPYGFGIFFVGVLIPAANFLVMRLWTFVDK